MATMGNMSRVRIAIAGFVAGGLVLAGCGGGDDEPPPESAPSASATPSPTEEAAPDTSPFTGETVGGEQPDNPVLVAKIDNSVDSSPQFGLKGADMVVEELVEGGITRLAVFYYSDLPERVGPIRSMRTSDVDIVKPVGGRLVTSGGAPIPVAAIDKAKITYYPQASAGFSRDDSRVVPHNLFVDLGTLASSIKGYEPTRPQSYLPFAEDAEGAELPQGKPAKTIEATFQGGDATDWTYGGSTYTNTNSNAEEGDRFDPATVLVLRVEISDAGYTDAAGSRVPATDFTGTGGATIFNGGRAIAATWEKKADDSSVSLTSADGEELSLPPGKVWIELVPTTGGDVSYR